VDGTNGSWDRSKREGDRWEVCGHALRHTTPRRSTIALAASIAPLCMVALRGSGGGVVLPPRRPVGRTDAGPPLAGRAALDPAALNGMIE